MKLSEVIDVEKKRLVLKAQQALLDEFDSIVDSVKLKSVDCNSPPTVRGPRFDYGWSLQLLGPLTDFTIDLLFKPNEEADGYNLLIEGRTEVDLPGDGIRLRYVPLPNWKGLDIAAVIIQDTLFPDAQIRASSTTYHKFFFNKIVKLLPDGWRPFYKSFKLKNDEFHYARLDCPDKHVSCGVSLQKRDVYEYLINGVVVHNRQDVIDVLANIEQSSPLRYVND